MKTEFPLCEVFWVDAGLESHNLTDDEAKLIEPMKRSNVGYLMANDKKKLTLCYGFIDDKGQRICDQSLVIPRGCVKSMRIIPLA